LAEMGDVNPKVLAVLLGIDPATLYRKRKKL
jgi:hypothetical protein